jgi:hypothetical protein
MLSSWGNILITKAKAHLLVIAFLLPAAAQTQTFSARDIGPADTEHTRSTDGYRSNSIQIANDGSYVAGRAKRFAEDGTDLGYSLWLNDGSETKTFFLSGIQDSDSSGYQSGSVEFISDNGHLAGSSNRYLDGIRNGSFAWVYNPHVANPKPKRVGFYKSKNTNNVGYRLSSIGILNNNGQAAGISNVYFGSRYLKGETVWIYDGSTTIEIGLLDEVHHNAYGMPDNELKLMNDAGIVAGEARQSGVDGTSAWVYNGTETLPIGLLDAGHTDETNNSSKNWVREINEAGHIAGRAWRNNFNGVNEGQTAWVYNGSETIPVSLSDPKHTYNNFYRYGSVVSLNEAGQALGYSHSYANPAPAGNSSWLFNGSTTVVIGLMDDEHTRNDGINRMNAYDLSESGYVLGYSERFSETDVELGESPWRYNSANGETLNISLINAEHTRSSDGFRRSNLYFLNEAGQAAGWAIRYNAAGDEIGTSGQFFDGSTSHAIGLKGAAHTDPSTGYQNNRADILTDDGLVAGAAYRSGDQYLGRTAWFFDGTETISMGNLSVNSNGYAFSEITRITDDGIALGFYKKYDENDYSVDYGFAYHTDWGFIELGAVIEPDPEQPDWQYLDEPLTVNSNDELLGNANLPAAADGSSSFTAYAFSAGDLVVQIDIVPWNVTNEIDLSTNDPIQVVVETTETSAGEAVNFDATQVNPASLRFGPGEALISATPWPIDIDNDEDTDVAFSFLTADSGIACGDQDATLTGATYSGTNFSGTAAVTPINCDISSCHP